MGDPQIIVHRLTPNGTSADEQRQRQPSLHLLTRENSNIYLNNCVPLYKAALKGDWKSAKKLLEKDPTMLCASITKGHATVLHIAAGARQTSFVEELIKLMNPEDLTLPDKKGNTAFCCAAAAGATEIARIMLKKDLSLLTTRGGENTMPVFVAALLGQVEMASYLYDELSQAKHVLIQEDKTDLFFTCLTTNGLYDLALKLLKEDPELAMVRDDNYETALHVLARKPSIFSNKNQGLFRRLITSFSGLMKLHHNKDFESTKALQLVKCLWEEMLKQDDLELEKLTQTPSRIIFEAAKFGNFQFLAELICRYPDLIYQLDENGYSIFHIAVLHRHANVFKLIYEIGLAKDLFVTYEDHDKKNNMLHLAAKLPHPSRIGIVSGTALQMQRELLWFKEIEKIVQPSFRERENSNGQTPQELFTQEHKELLKRGEQWMKNTANSCMLVATIITTIIFAAVFSVPGGNDSSKGLPIHLKEIWFQVFVISDAIALSSSSISILMFLSILTSRYIEDDFLKSLPFKLMVGLSTLFISIITMMVAFCTTLLLAYHDRLNCVTVLTTVVASVPATLYVLLQYPLLADIFCSTYQSRFLFKPSKTIF